MIEEEDDMILGLLFIQTFVLFLLLLLSMMMLAFGWKLGGWI